MNLRATIFSPTFNNLKYNFFSLFFSVAKRGGTCSKVVKPQYCTADLHYNQTFVPERNQSTYSVLQGILNSKCSSEFEKYLCYTSVPPCKPNDLSVYVPCRDICEQVSKYGALMQREFLFYYFTCIAVHLRLTSLLSAFNLTRIILTL